MTERDALLAAIHANPDDDLHRLVFADWLDENRASDFDDALAESIRLACTGKARKKSAVRWTKWLHTNWLRLIPTLASKHIGTDKYPVPHFSGRSGAVVSAAMVWPTDEPFFAAIPGWPPKCRMNLFRMQFASGFLKTIIFWEPDMCEFARPLVLADFPYCEVRRDDPNPRVAMYRRRYGWGRPQQRQ